MGVELVELFTPTHFFLNWPVRSSLGSNRLVLVLVLVWVVFKTESNCLENNFSVFVEAG